MNVGQLIRALKKMPVKADVYFANHDHSEYETDNIVNRARYMQISKMSDSEKEQRTPGNPEEDYVVLRP